MDDQGLVAGLIVFSFFVFFGIFVLSATSSRSEVAFLIRLFMIAFGLRFAMSIVIYEFGLVRILGDEDSSGWAIGKYLCDDWLAQEVGLFSLPSILSHAYEGHHRGYYYLVGVFFYFTSLPFRLSAAALNCFFGAWTAIIGYRTARMLFNERIAIQTGWWICFFPSLIVWSAQTLKEPVVILLESLVIYSCVVQQRQGVSIKHAAIIVFTIVVLIPFRFYAAYLASLAFFVTFLLRGIAETRSASVQPLVYFIGTAAFALGLSIYLLDRERDLELFQNFDLEKIEKFREGVVATSESGVKAEYGLRSSQGLVISLLIGGLHLLLAPFPWQFASGSFRMILVAPEILLWWWLLFTGVIPGLVKCIRTRLRDVVSLLIMVVGLGLLYSLMFSNVGLIYRQRAQLLPWLIIFAVVGRDKALLGAAQSAVKQEETDSGMP
jgi:hypothetical protein